jgi:hypothetical protein
MHIHTGGGGIENFNTVPSTICEMFIQSFQNKLRLFPDWPVSTYAKFGDLLTYGGFLVSSDMEKNAVQYVRIISTMGRSCTFVNPWTGQALRIYRNGIDSGTVTGSEITLATSVNETIHIAPDGTSYGEILARMSMPGGTVTGVVDKSHCSQPGASFAIIKGMGSRTISFVATNDNNDTRRLTIGIYSVNGKLIKKLFSNGNVVRWDMTDKGNVRVPIGAYVWKIKLERRNEEVGRTGILEVER